MVFSQSWQPSTEATKDAWSINFGNVLPIYADLLGITAAELADAKAGAAYSVYLKVFRNAQNAWGIALTNYHHTLRHNPEGVETPMPVLVLPDVVPPVKLGYLDRQYILVSIMKLKKNLMNDTIAKALKIANTEITIDELTVKPILNASIGKGHQARLGYGKGPFGGMAVYKLNAAGTFDKKGSTTTSTWTDDTPLPPTGQAVVYTFKCKYLIGNDEVGLFSQVISITVTGV